MRTPALLCVICASCLACGDSGADGGDSTETSETQADTSTDTDTGTDTGGDPCEAIDLGPGFTIEGESPTSGLNFGGECSVTSVEFDAGTFQLLLNCDDGSGPFALGIQLDDLDAQPGALSPGGTVDVFILRESAVNIETDPESWFEIQSGGQLIAAGHVRAHGLRKVGPIDIEAMTACEVVEGDPLPRGYIHAETEMGAVEIELGESGVVTDGGLSWAVYARESIPSCCFGYESSVIIVRQ